MNNKTVIEKVEKVDNIIIVYLERRKGLSLTLVTSINLDSFTGGVRLKIRENHMIVEMTYITLEVY